MPLPAGPADADAPGNGADVQRIQALFGHVKLTTTEIYTHVAITKLKQVHTATHPAALLLPPPRAAGQER